jgi:alpha-galactosidase
MSKRKITLIGGGSAKFVRELSVDFFSYPLLQDSHICLMDINRERVELSERLIKKIIADRKLSATVSSTLDQREAIADSDYVIITIMVGGLEAYKNDVAIPARYGVYQTVSDTTGPGGVFRTIRTAPVLQKIAADVLELAPDAWVLNYANPMSMNILSLTRAGLKNVVGLCHSIQHLYRGFGHWLGIPAEEIQYTAGGINHIDFYLTVSHKGENLYPRLLAEKDRIIKENPAEITRFALLEHLGYFPAEGPHHQSEYYSWFRKDEAGVKRTAAETGWGYSVDSQGFHHRTAEIEEQLANKKPISYERSEEYGARIIHALEGGEAEVFYGNVPNRGLIENLPDDCIAEVPCLVDRNGIVPGRVGAIPPQLAAVMRPHIALHDLAVTGTFQKDRRLIYQAVQADPLTSAVLTLPRIKEMVDDMFAHNKEFVSDWK